ncbi:MAG TPA: response regulator [Candidatus Acidoferrum sp.]|jgi:CheY-like chemotaxis protein|nr:response regulator [Candidatus Acidoferrum sp.]
MRVLVVEDEEPLGEVFRDFLAEMGHDPIIVRSAEAALGSLERQRPDAIILDINLPGMSGLDFLQLRPVKDAALPIVAISGVATEGQARECLRLGALDFVGKPVPLDRLNEVLTFLEPHALTRRRAESAKHERRRGPRAQIGFPVRIVEYKGTAWDGVCTELSATGMKIRSNAVLPEGSAVKLLFTPPDGAAPVEVISLVVRIDREATAFSFVHLANAEARRLSELVQRLQRP